MRFRDLLSVLRYERAVNRREFKIQCLLFHFRVTQFLMGEIKNPRKVSYPAVLFYRLFSEWLLGIELRPTTRVSRGLRIFHGVGLVVNPDAIVGSDVVLRNGVVIGNRGDSACPRIGDGVEIGAAALILGDIVLGRGCKVGAGAVVLHSVPADAVAVGNPARVLGPKGGTK